MRITNKLELTKSKLKLLGYNIREYNNIDTVLFEIENNGLYAIFNPYINKAITPLSNNRTEIKECNGILFIEVEDKLLLVTKDGKIINSINKFFKSVRNFNDTSDKLFVKSVNNNGSYVYLITVHKENEISYCIVDGMYSKVLSYCANQKYQHSDYSVVVDGVIYVCYEYSKEKASGEYLNDKKKFHISQEIYVVCLYAYDYINGKSIKISRDNEIKINIERFRKTFEQPNITFSADDIADSNHMEYSISCNSKECNVIKEQLELELELLIKGLKINI